MPWGAPYAIAQPALIDVAVECPGRVPGCDRDFFQIETPFARFVRDRGDADVYVFALSDRTGGGGREITLALTGRRRFAGLADTLTVQTGPDATDDDERRAFLGRLQLGLARFASRTGLADRLSLVYRAPVGGELEPETEETGEVRDPWNGWTFRLGGRGSLSGESQVRSYDVSEFVRASRVTDEWKMLVRQGGDYSEDRFTFESDGGGDTTRVRSVSSVGIGGYAVRSLSRQLSVGAGAGASQQSFRNYDLRLRVGPAIEYNLFPYAEATRRQLAALYAIGVERAVYTDSTIFGELDETLLQQQASLNAEFTQPWGEIDLRVSASQYLSVARSYNLGARADVSLRLARGLQLSVRASGEIIRDQRYLLAAGASAEEVLTRQRALATGFEYSGSVGLSYTFGSAFRAVVNPRFDDGFPF